MVSKSSEDSPTAWLNALRKPPADCARCADPEMCRRRGTVHAARNRGISSVLKILQKRCCNPCRPPFTSRKSELQHRRKRKPCRRRTPENRSNCEAEWPELGHLTLTRREHLHSIYFSAIASDCANIMGVRALKPRETTVLYYALFCVFVGAIALGTKGVSIFRPEAYLSNVILYICSFFLIESFHVLSDLYKRRPESPFAHIRTLYSGSYVAKFRAGLPIILGLIVFMPAFSAMKSAIPLFNEYTWDKTFILIDRTIHGTDPWRILQPIFGLPIFTAAISAIYHLWILLIYVGSIYVAIYVKDRQLVINYFVTYLSVWVFGGIILATAFASVGPCFVQPLIGLDTFSEKMDLLYEANKHFPIMVLEVQESLLQWNKSGDFGLGRGITAMPSMHVALSFLFFLAMRRVNRTAGRIFFVFFILIFVGSVHTAYHYAVDGYLSILLTLVIWKLVGRLTSRDSMESDKRGMSFA